MIDDFARRRPNDVVRRAGTAFMAIEAAEDLIEEAFHEGIKVLGLDGFLIDGEVVYPALSRIADFSADSPTGAYERAKELLRGQWVLPPTQADQMHSEARGRHMVDVVLDE